MSNHPQKKCPVNIHEEAERLATSIARPNIPDREVVLLEQTTFRPDYEGTYDFRPLIQKQIDALAEAGGGTLVISHPAGIHEWFKTPVTYRLNGPLQLRSRIRLALEPSIRLAFDFAPHAYTDGGRGYLCRYEGTTIYGPSACLRASGAEDFEIVGLYGSGGTPEIDGNGLTWQRWSNFGEQDREARGLTPSYQRLKHEVNNAGMPLSERQFGDCNEWLLRPDLFQPIGCKRLRMHNLRIVNAPMWCLHPVWSEDCVFEDLQFYARAVNNDGIDPESCRRVLIERIVFDNNDDNIAIKAGRDREAREGVDLSGTEMEGLDLPWLKNKRSSEGTSEVVIRDCYFKGHYAICVGSEMSGGVHDVFAVDCVIPQEVLMVFNIKSARTRGGLIERIFVKGIRGHRATRAVVSIVPNYDNDTTGEYPPEVRDVWVEDVHLRHSREGVVVYGWGDLLTRDIYLKNISVDTLSGSPLTYNHVEGLTLENVKLGGEDHSGTYAASETEIETPFVN